MNASRTPKDIHRTIAELSQRACHFAVAVVLKAEGSTPRKAGAKAVFDAQGFVEGTIGGGSVEAEAGRCAIVALQSGRPMVFDFNLAGGAAARSHPICGGAMRVLIDPTAAVHGAAYAAAADSVKRRRRGALLTTVRGTDHCKVEVQFLDECAIPPEIGFPGGEAIRSVCEQEEAALFVSEGIQAAQRIEILVEPLSPRPVVLIVGGGHIGQAVAAQASLVGFEVVVIDDRPEFTNPKRFPEGVNTRSGNIPEEVARFPLAAETYVVIATRSHQLDREALAACLHRPAAYVGMIGSRRKVALLRKDLVESGRATEAELDRLYAPIGLEIGAVTVPEIATSIVAQLIAVRRERRLAVNRNPLKYL